MKKSKLLSIVAVAAAIITSFSTPLTAEAVSRTETTELLGTGGTAEEAIGAATTTPTTAPTANPQVLGAQRSNVAGEVTVSNITDPTALAQLNDLELFAKLISDYTHQVVKASDITILDSMEVTARANVEVSATSPLFVTFGFPSITGTTDAYVFHYGETGWQIVPTSVVEGLVTGEFTKLSPVAIVVKTDTLKGAVLGAGRKKSPRTGDNSYMYIVVCAAVAACGTGYVTKKKLFS